MFAVLSFTENRDSEGKYCQIAHRNLSHLTCSIIHLSDVHLCPPNTHISGKIWHTASVSILMYHSVTLSSRQKSWFGHIGVLAVCSSINENHCLCSLCSFRFIKAVNKTVNSTQPVVLISGRGTIEGFELQKCINKAYRNSVGLWGDFGWNGWSQYCRSCDVHQIKTTFSHTLLIQKELQMVKGFFFPWASQTPWIQNLIHVALQ